jgi:hypothetical protein
MQQIIETFASVVVLAKETYEIDGYNSKKFAMDTHQTLWRSFYNPWFDLD